MIIYDFCSKCGKKRTSIIQKYFWHDICECGEKIHDLSSLKGVDSWYSNMFEQPFCPDCRIEPIMDRKNVKYLPFFKCPKCGLSGNEEIKRNSDIEDSIKEWRSIVEERTKDIEISRNALLCLNSIKEKMKGL